MTTEQIIGEQVKQWEIAKNNVESGFIVTLSKDNRAIEENRKAWLALQDIMGIGEQNEEREANDDYFEAIGWNDAIRKVRQAITNRLGE